MADRLIFFFVALIALYLLIVNADAANNILRAIGNAYREQVSALQGGL